MRCYFHLVNEIEQITDHHGVEVSTIEAAYAQAMSAIVELREEVEKPADLVGWRLTGVDQAGAVLLSITL
ncbi:DUF6894 family protein [Microvirga pudoricolor]|uniref:DUF6894 family protein n=1 Tax=Microvirga pudoricolor TaxID=2778729 RepID=UPI00194F5752|nr:hypothetical protein [Microvirga pudoricolor]MBM6595468.1 hypothetical protein [Microvirga pudoricolor]